MIRTSSTSMTWPEYSETDRALVWMLHEAGALTKDEPVRVEIKLIWDDDAQA